MMVVPADTPETTPDVLTVATDGLVLIHMLPLVAPPCVSVIAEPVHTSEAPDIVPGAGSAVTDTPALTTAEQYPSVTV